MTAADNVRALIADHRRHERACRAHAARLRREASSCASCPPEAHAACSVPTSWHAKRSHSPNKPTTTRAAAALLANTPNH